MTVLPHSTPRPRPTLRLQPLHPLSRRLQDPLLSLPHGQWSTRVRDELFGS